MQVNIPWQELAVGAKPCPKCGKIDPHYRHYVFYKETDAVCCGGEAAVSIRLQPIAKMH